MGDGLFVVNDISNVAPARDMIQVFGAEDTREQEAALALRNLMVKAWPSVADSPIHDVRIVAGAKCHGQQKRDIDVLLLASFDTGLEYRPFLSFQGADGQYHKPNSVQVRSLCVVIEVKDHRPEDVRFVGTAVEVSYGSRWHNASEQNEGQVYSVKRYLEYHGIHPPWISSLLWLRNVPTATLPPRPHPNIGAQVTWDLILNVLGQMHPPRWRDGRWVISAIDQDYTTLTRVTDLFTKILEPTRLDRQRMERLSKQHVDLATLQEAVGKKLVILWGRGGTGKTMHLLQFAKQLFDEQGARVLILTYNKALVADIRRLLTILGIGNGISGGAIHIQTVHSFLYSALQGLGIIDQYEPAFLANYEHLKNQALEFLQIGAVSQIDVEQLAKSNVEAFRWDYVFVDEGQDWPSNERDLLMRLYSYKQIVVADGVDQLVRGHVQADWRGTLRQSEIRKVNLRRCLRMKAGLVRFASTVARQLNLPEVEWEVDEDVLGGQVIILEGDYFNDRELHDRLLKDNADNGNSPVDMLFCVPPSLVVHSAEFSTTHSIAATVFERWGFRTWDGASEDVRESYPTDLDQLRIVQYESCRGLEGWTVVCLGLDQFYEFKMTTIGSTPALAQTPGVFARDTVALKQAVARWLLIPLTRAIDTLVIQVENRQSPMYSALAVAAAEYPDVVKWMSV
jgi:hypothetical protein